jgi:hypothetical protein
MLNRALRMSDVDIIIKMGFFIGDLHRQIETLHREQFGGHQTGKTLIVYRGQGLSKTDFDQLTNTKGGLMSFNNFLSTSKNRHVSLDFARKALADPDSVGILFVMTIDTSQSTTPFASINSVSYFEDKEDEVLFSMHTVFRIGGIKPMGENHRLVQVDLTLTGDNDKDLRVLTDRIREESDPNRKLNKSMKPCLNRALMRVRKEIFIVSLGRSSESKENIKKQSHSMKNHLKSTRKLFLRIILVWLYPTTTSVMCMKTWVTIRKHFRLTKKPLKFNNNHFLRIILIWVLPTTTSVWCMTTWVTIRKHFRLTKKPLKFDNNHFLRIILVWLLPATTSVWRTKT